MEDILASIRRILNEDEVAPVSPAAVNQQMPSPPNEPNAGGSGGGDDDGVLVLDEAMLVTPPPVAPEHEMPLPVPVPIPVPVPASTPSNTAPEPTMPVAAGAVINEGVLPPPPSASSDPHPIAPDIGSGLLGAESAAAAASSVGALLRTISEERTSQVHRGGPTIEDVVREEIRPLLKVWLDQHLPPMVERLVRQEIERVTGRAVP